MPERTLAKTERALHGSERALSRSERALSGGEGIRPSLEGPLIGRLDSFDDRDFDQTRTKPQKRLWSLERPGL